ncbi:MAG TPA: hypothetical protein VIK38_03945, partial [Coriobacteriia bacterium]
RMEGFVLREDVPDRLGQLASEVDPGDLGAALAPEALLRALVSLQVARVSCSVGGEVRSLLSPDRHGARGRQHERHRHRTPAPVRRGEATPGARSR